MKDPFVQNGIYHICNKSIQNYQIFSQNECIQRLILCIDHYNNRQPKNSLSKLIREKHIFFPDLLSTKQEAVAQIIAYCIMPDHYHLLVKLLVPNAFSQYISNIENSYTRYFNLSHNRKGPLWQNRFKHIMIKSNEQLLHVSRYIHLNPTTSKLVKNPQDWPYSSYTEYLTNQDIYNRFPEISIHSSTKYQQFVENQIEYQQILKQVKTLLLED